MAKIFDNVQELWDYVLYCPICKKYCRDISLCLDPEEIIIPDPIVNFEIIDNINYLIIDFEIAIRNQFNSVTKIITQLKINCLTNSFELKDEEVIIPILLKKLSKINSKFCFYIQSYCDCGKSSTYGDDVEIDFSDKKVKNIKLEREVVEFYISSAEIYEIEQRHDQNVTLIDKYHVLDDGHMKRKSTYKAKLLEIDFSDLQKAFNRVKTILVFN